MEKYELSFPQNNIYMAEKKYQNSNINIITGLFYINDKFDFKKAENLCIFLTNCFDNFKIEIIEKDGNVYQNICSNNMNISKKEIFDEKELDKYLKDVSEVPFDIKEQLYELTIIKTSENTGIIITKLHHLISDAWTFSLISKFLSEGYEKLLNNEDLDEGNSYSYLDFLNSEKEYINSEKYIKDEKYWNEYLKDIETSTRFKEKTVTTNNSKRYSVTLSMNDTTRINNYCRDNKVSIYNLFMGVITTYLYRTTDNNDVVLGTPILNRFGTKQKNTMGMFISTMPVRIKVEENVKFIDLVKSIGKDSFTSFRHQKYPIANMIREYKKNNEDSNLYNIVFSYQNAKVNNFNKELFSTKWFPNNHILHEFEMHILDTDDRGKLDINYDYITDIFEDIEIKYIHSRFMEIVNHATCDINIDVENINIMTNKERYLILNKFNDTDKEYDKDKTIIDLFEEQVKKNPKNVAIVFENQKLTYEELNSRANSLARYLIEEKEVKSQDRIGIIIDRSIDMMIGILAILKCNCSYVPMETDFPQNRIEYILKDANCNILLVNDNIDIDKKYLVNINIDYNNYLNTNIDLFDRKYIDEVYVIYTSGTTGRPKGVSINNRNVIRLIVNTNYIKISKEDRILQTGSIAFDATSFEYYIALLNGLPLYLFNKNLLMNFKSYKSYIDKNKITIMFFTPQLFNKIVEYNVNTFEKLNTIILGGEVVSIKHTNMVKKLFPNIVIINGYGPTENTTFSTYYELNKMEYKNIPIGKPISNSKCYIVNNKEQLLPLYVSGELLVGGDGVSSGYLNKENLNKEKFKNIEYLNDYIYKTGDLCYYDKTGNINFLGRIDSQVKINGHRIEISEIESVINRIEGLTNSVIIIKEINNIKYIISYYEGTVNEIEIRNYCQSELPNYMIPNKFIKLQELPRTSSLKIDRKRLFDLDIIFNKIITNNKKLIKLNDFEKEVLDEIKNNTILNDIDIYTNILDLNLDSLAIIKLLMNLNDKFNINLEYSELINFKNVKKLIEFISRSKKLKDIKNKDVILEKAKLNSSLTNIYLASLKNEKMYHIPFELRLDKGINSKKLVKAIEEVLIKNQIFSSRIENIGNDTYFVFDIKNHKLELFKVNENEFLQNKELFVENFKNKLYKIQVYNVNGINYVLCDFHHLIFDGLSFEIFLNKVKEAYDGNELKYEPYVEKNISKEKYYEAKEFFEYEFHINELPCDYKIKKNNFSGRLISNKINKDLNESIKEYVKNNALNLNSFYLAAFNILISKYTYSNEVVLDLASNTRRSKEDFNKVGMNVNTLPFKSKIEGDIKVLEYINNIKSDIIKTIDYNMFDYTSLKTNNPALNILYVFQNSGLNTINIDECNVNISFFERNTSKFDLTCEILPNNEDIIVNFEYSSELFKKSTINKLLKHYLNILKYVVNNNDSKLNEIEMLSKNEISDLLVSNEYKYDEEINIVKLFEKQVEKAPNDIALIFKNKKVTFKELNNYSNYIAKYINEKGFNKETIGVLTNRSFEMIIFILGILKSGNSYLPIDPDYPQSRISHMIKDSNAKLILSKLNTDKFNFEQVNITIDDMLNESISNLNIDIDKNDMAYIIYTSGSTGVPKGVMIKHDSITNLYHYFSKELEYVDKKYVMGCITTMSFDIFLSESLVPLCAGQTVVVADEEEQKLPSKLNKLIKDNNINILQTTPSKLKIFIDNINQIEYLKNIKYIMLIGEIIKVDLIRNIKNKIKNVHIYNGYGPTEATDICTCKKDIRNKINIGNKLYNTNILVLDKYNKLCPLNVKGEICVSGKGLAIGYNNLKENTNKSFIYNKYIDNKIYKTGDIGSYLQSGEIQCFGREDNQIKLNGLRIELSEIENVVSTINDVKDAVIILKDKALICFYTSKNKKDISYIRDYAKNYLPLYMVPKYFVMVDDFKYTPNGKIDRLDLQKKDIILENQIEIVNPKTNTEKIIYNVLSTLLENDSVSIKDDFFEIGMDSILAIKLQVELKHKNIDVKYEDIYKYMTIEKLANKIDNNISNITYDISNYNKDFSNILLSNRKEVLPKKKNVENVLLTGVTGFLGAHILDEYMKKEDGNIYCLIRKKEKDLSVDQRLKNTLNFYFGNKYYKYINKRIFVIEGDITLENLTLDKSNFNIINKVDFIIHTAAIVKHYGDFKLFEDINIKGTKNICDFALKNNIKVIHASTISISGNSAETASIIQNISENKEFNETSFYIGQSVDNAYLYSKFKAEEIIFEYINKGLSANIIRLGNLTSRCSDGVFQPNIDENAFVKRFKSILQIGYIPKNLLEMYVEFTPIDYTAKLIIKVMEYFNNDKNIIHAYNHNHIYFDKLIEYLRDIEIDIKVVDEEIFKKNILKILEENSDKLEGIIGDLDNDNKLDYFTNITVSSRYSIEYFEKINFKWPQITKKYVIMFIKYLIENKYINGED